MTTEDLFYKAISMEQFVEWLKKPGNLRKHIQHMLDTAVKFPDFTEGGGPSGRK